MHLGRGRVDGVAATHVHVIVKCDTVSIEHLQMTNVPYKLLNFVFVLQDKSSPGLDSSLQ